jgi:hypothetical protein
MSASSGPRCKHADATVLIQESGFALKVRCPDCRAEWRHGDPARKWADGAIARYWAARLAEIAKGSKT